MCILKNPRWHNNIENRGEIIINYLTTQSGKFIADSDMQKPKQVDCPSYAVVYAAILPIVQNIGRQHGYAIAAHGSMGRDLDLLACPWIEEPADPETLVEAIMLALHCVLLDIDSNPVVKPHGRLAWTLHFRDSEGPIAMVNGPYVDLSIMPKFEENLAMD